MRQIDGKKRCRRAGRRLTASRYQGSEQQWGLLPKKEYCRIDDIATVVAHQGNAPTLMFTGRAGLGGADEGEHCSGRFVDKNYRARRLRYDAEDGLFLRLSSSQTD